MLTPPEIWSLRTSGAANQPGWSIRVVPNRYPCVHPEARIDPVRVEPDRSKPGLGVHEIIIETADHDADLADCDAVHWEALLGVYQDRVRASRTVSEVAHALLFKNAGFGSGASQPHAHAQLLAVSETLPVVDEELSECERYFALHGRSPFRDLFERETRERRRVVTVGNRFWIHCPYASRFPFEAWVLPIERSGRFEDHPRDDVWELGSLLRRLLIARRRLMDHAGYNVYFHTPPFDGRERSYYDWHVELTPRLVGLAGFEVGGGLAINPIPPEWAAERFREALPS